MEEDLFNEMMSNIRNRKFGKVDAFLNKNKGKYEKEPEYYVLLLNYVGSKAESRDLVIAQGKAEKGDLVLVKEGDEKPTGFIGERVTNDYKLILDGIRETRHAQKYFRKRLDIYFGIAAIAERSKQWKLVGDVMVDILRVSKEIDNKWEWGSINSMDGDPEDFMIQNILSRTSMLFRNQNRESDKAMSNISFAMIKYYPDIIYGYANLGVLNMAHGDFDKAEEYLMKALKIDDQDKIVLGNLDYLKKLRSDKKSKKK
jgi:hypothetical protein